jgi:hypothetical protein
MEVLNDCLAYSASRMSFLEEYQSDPLRTCAKYRRKNLTKPAGCCCVGLSFGLEKRHVKGKGSVDSARDTLTREQDFSWAGVREARMLRFNLKLSWPLLGTLVDRSHRRIFIMM